MHSVVVATMLTGGLALGDAGGGVDPGGVCVDFGGEWEGTWQEGGGMPHRVEVHLHPRGEEDPALVTRWAAPLWGGRFPAVTPLFIAAQGEGRVRVGVPRPDCDGIYRMGNGRLLICFSHRPGKRPTSFVPALGEELWVLHRPRQRK